MKTILSLAAAIVMAGSSLVQSAPLPPPRPATLGQSDQSFVAFREGLVREAIGRGHDADLVRSIFSGVALDERVLEAISRQGEFVRPVFAYLDSALSEARVARGRAERARLGGLPEDIARGHGVPSAILFGIWGMETNFGSFMGNHDVVAALATLAFASHRRDYFRSELMAAVDLVARGEIARGALRGSWAGAIGHTQFMPSNVLRLAIDGDGDGRRDLLGSIPDALASSAHFLVRHGWTPGLPALVEVRLSPRHDWSLETAPFSAFARTGTTRIDGSPLPERGEARLFLPAGVRGPAFLVTSNFDVIKRYNPSEAYALAVVALGELVAGRPGIVASFPRDEAPLTRDERIAIQTRLAAMGLYDGPINGIIGPRSRAAIGLFQRARALVPDGHADRSLLSNLTRNGPDMSR